MKSVALLHLFEHAISVSGATYLVRENTGVPRLLSLARPAMC